MNHLFLPFPKHAYRGQVSKIRGGIKYLFTHIETTSSLFHPEYDLVGVTLLSLRESSFSSFFETRLQVKFPIFVDIEYSFDLKDDIYMNKHDCCWKCYMQFVDGREDRWADIDQRVEFLGNFYKGKDNG